MCFTQCLRIERNILKKTKKKHVINRKFNVTEVEYGIHFDDETGFFKHIQLYFTPKKIFLKSCLIRDMNSIFNVKPLNTYILY